MTILVVDDDDMVRDATSEILKRAGFEVIMARDGIDALEKYRSRSSPISVVLMDVIMPRLGGIEATRKIREMDPAAKVVLASGYSEQPLSDAKPDAFLSKPYGAINLELVIEKVLRAG